MAEHTAIQWADSTVNPAMGCDGCELARPDGSVEDRCYAKVLTDRRSAGKGNSGWPASFFSPQLFPGRIEKACRWPDLTGKDRADKPWFNGLPRHIFLDDLGDTFTESLPLDWIAPHINAMAASPHVWIFLTKRPERMLEFFNAYGSVPDNFLLGTSCTASVVRARLLAKLKGRFPDSRIWISGEPLWKDLDFSPWLERLAWLVIGGESGPRAKPFDLTWAYENVYRCEAFGTPLFIKQLGSNIVHALSGTRDGISGGAWTRWKLKDRQGGDWSEWPESLRVRQPSRPAPMSDHYPIVWGCPFCGRYSAEEPGLKRQPHSHTIEFTKAGSWQISCWYCGARGPLSDSVREAGVRWRNRADTQGLRSGEPTSWQPGEVAEETGENPAAGGSL